MTNLYLQLSSFGLYAAEVISSKEKEEYTTIFHDKYIIVYSFLEGEPVSTLLKFNQFDNTVISSTVKNLRKLHLGTNGRNTFDLPQLQFNVTVPNLYYSVLHFDLTKDNIFANIKSNKENQIGFIDFDDSRYGSSVCDIAILISDVFFSKIRGVDIEDVNTFIDEYYGNELQLKKETKLIKPFALEWILSNANLNSSITERFEVKRRLIKENLFL